MMLFWVRSRVRGAELDVEMRVNKEKLRVARSVLSWMSVTRLASSADALLKPVLIANDHRSSIITSSCLNQIESPFILIHHPSVVCLKCLNDITTIYCVCPKLQRSHRAYCFTNDTRKGSIDRSLFLASSADEPAVGNCTPAKFQ